MTYNPIIVALDLESAAEARTLADRLGKIDFLRSDGLAAAGWNFRAQDGGRTCSST
jgi:hypothetical protein